MRRIRTMALVLLALSVSGPVSAQSNTGSVTIRAAAASTGAIPILCPVPGAKFIDDWGQARNGGRSHEGTDMMAASGTQVLAPTSGTVKFDRSGRGGLQFWLSGEDGRRYFGAHLSEFGTEGDVQAGAVIGYVGSTGNAGTPHLHFEIHLDKKTKINPYSHLRAACVAGSSFTVTVG